MEMEAVKLSSDSEIDENEENVAAVGKKRGRPAKGGSKAAVVKSGRGRGRPPKDPEANAERLKLANEEKANGVGNGKQRGRPAKGGKTKLSHSIVATGKGRGRPKSANEDDGENNAVSPKKTTPGKGGRGRPKKEVSESDEERSVDGKEESPNEAEEDDDDEERRPIGRPSTGAVNLNIQRTGRGQGRPKKDKAEKRTGANSSGGEEDIPKKRGRPVGNAPAKQATGKPRGRPKPIEVNDSEEGENGDENPPAHNSESEPEFDDADDK